DTARLLAVGRPAGAGGGRGGAFVGDGARAARRRGAAARHLRLGAEHVVHAAHAGEGRAAQGGGPRAERAAHAVRGGRSKQRPDRAGAVGAARFGVRNGLKFVRRPLGGPSANLLTYFQ